MRTRNRTVARLFAAILLLLLASTPGRASLECDGAFAAGTFSTTTFIDGAFPEDACGAGGSSSLNDKTGVSLDGVSIGF